jgi:hypothetical protein
MPLHCANGLAGCVAKSPVGRPVAAVGHGPTYC